MCLAQREYVCPHLFVLLTTSETVNSRLFLAQVNTMEGQGKGVCDQPVDTQMGSVNVLWASKARGVCGLGDNAGRAKKQLVSVCRGRATFRCEGLLLQGGRQTQGGRS